MKKRYGFALALVLGIAAVGRGQLPIVTYHCHENLGWQAARFVWHADFYNRHGYNTITCEQFWEWYSEGTPLPPRPLMITVDDNYIKNYTEMYPVLLSRNLKAVNFVITNSASNTNGLPSCDYSQLRLMDASGLFESQSHSLTHPYLTTLSQTQQRSQLLDSRTRLETEMGKSTRFFAYPYGDYNALTVSECATAGYYGAFTYNTGVDGLAACAKRTSPPYQIERLAVDYCSTEAELKTRIGFLEPIPAGGGWTCDDTEVAALFDASAWSAVTAPSGASVHGVGYRQRTAAYADKDFRWRTTLPKVGYYRVYAKWFPKPTNATNAQYSLAYNGLTQWFATADQTQAAGWNLLGKIMIADTDAPVEVVLADKGAGNLVADTVWFEWVAATPPASVDDWALVE